ncbi:sugar porter family MFS transporter [Streptomyces sp. NRRL S-350]|uniref:sugar porter family MFS transporter n=1 Tax=Streptomyces sp. NRRL S-350 TaxID=1463902 RepID=UPI0004C05C42|nr:sugar porter family MFS transporter [Streptomyces sp. NRRL S-350]
MSVTQKPSGAVEAPAPGRLGFVVFITAAAALGGFLFGYDSSVINGAVSGIQDKFGVGDGVTGLIVSSALLGSAIGAALAGRFADRYGRIKVMKVAALLFAVSAVGSMLPFSAWDLALWRVLGGAAIGIASVIAPTYIAEVAPTKYRGRLASFQQAAIVLGIAISQLVNWVLARAAGGDTRGQLLGLEAWQWMLGICVVPAAVYFALSSVIPESPRFLIQADRLADARKVLAAVEGEGVDTDARIAEIQALIASDHRPRFRDLLGGRFGLLPIVWVGIGLSVFQQLVGINVIFYYSSILWQSVGIDQSNSLLISFIGSVINILGTVIAIVLVDRIGRKPLALIGSVGMAVALGAAGWAFSSATGSGDNLTLPDLQGTVALIAANAFVLFFAMSWGVVVWVMLGEMFPNRIRAAALSVAASAQWIANWAITVSFPSMSRWNLSVTYLIYAAFAALSALFVARYLKETKGIRLEDMG